jgi:hypothetical protein
MQTQIIQLGTLSAAVNEQINQAVASTTASAATATAAAATATSEAGVATAAAGTATTQATNAANSATASANSATASANAYSAIANGTATSAGALTGSETIPVSRGAGLLQTTWNTVASFIYSTLGILKTVSNVSALAALDASVWARVKTQGYGAVGDGGGGIYYQLTGMQTPNGGTIIAGINGTYFGLESTNEVTLAQFGALGANATVDETTQIQAALNWAFSSRKKLRASPNQSFLISSTLTININATIDFGQARFFPSTAFIAAGGYMVQMLGVMGTQQYNLGCTVGGLWLVGPRSTASNLDGVSFGGASTNVSNVDMPGWIVDGFRDNIYFGSNCYLLRFYGLINGTAWRYAEHYECAVNAGENISFHGGVIYNCQNSGSASGIYASTGNPFLDVNHFGVSFDYNDTNYIINAGSFRFPSCHWENGNQYPMGTMTYTSPYPHPAVYIEGGEIYLGTGGFNRQVYFQVNGASIFSARDVTWGNFEPGNSSVFVGVTGSPLKVKIDGFVNVGGNGTPLMCLYTNLLYNYNFTSTITSAWATNLQSGSAISTSNTYSFIGGTYYSFQFALNASNAQSISQSFGVAPGTYLLLNAATYASSLTSGSGSITVQFYAADGVTMIGSPVAIGATISANQAFASNGNTVRVPTGAASAKLLLGVTAGAGTIAYALPYACAM